MTSILCLAHYCDLHGPTPLMVTEGIPVPCEQCYDDHTELDRPQTSGTTGPQASVTHALRKMTLNSQRSSSSPASEHEGEAQIQRAAMRQASKLGINSAVSSSAIETPPQSPRKASDNGSESSNHGTMTGGLRRDASFRRTYDDYVTKRANPCQNCALTLPKRQSSKESKSKPSGNAADDKADQRGPTLRTRAPYARVYGGASRDVSPPDSNSQSSNNSEDEGDGLPTNIARPRSSRRPTTSTSRSSLSSKSSVNTHTHYLDYTSTHEPQVANTYSIVRNSCLRTLSFETLPRRSDSSASSTASSPVSSHMPSIPQPYISPALSINPAYISAPPTPQSAASGGPIFFGDSLNGYTTAYIFRIPDMHARGRKRVYAFLALTTHRERLAMKVFGFVAAAFRDLAAWVQELAEAEAERERDRMEEEGTSAPGLNHPYNNRYERGPRDSGVGLGLGGGSLADRDRERDRDSGSSFLTGGARGGFSQRIGMGGSMGPGGFAPKSRGLAELVGLPDFFIELHTRFVRLLLELGVVLGS
ncbi:vesicle coat protein [Xylariales sp. PMI_506]|nr:vesicle coat protein [Xylariales sp. PMI_506]